jgi:2,3-bisphosphoglycerate-dependent phosphoglycerate mutase
MTVFYLVRHAHAVWTLDENRPLSKQGEGDALRVAEVLRAYPVSAIYASPARRARQTVTPLAAQLGLPVYVAPELAERVLCAYAVDDFRGAVRATWDDFSFAHRGGETNAAAQRRGVRLVRVLAARYPDGHLVLGTHGNLLALVLCHYDPKVGYTFWKSLTMPDLYRLKLGEGGPANIERPAAMAWATMAPENVTESGGNCEATKDLRCVGRRGRIGSLGRSGLES